MSNVVALGPEPLPGEPCEKTVEALRKWLEMAERGELIGVALAGVRPGNGAIITDWAGTAARCTLMTAAVCLSTRVQAAWLAATEIDDGGPLVPAA